MANQLMPWQKDALVACTGDKKGRERTIGKVAEYERKFNGDLSTKYEELAQVNSIKDIRRVTPTDGQSIPQFHTVKMGL